MSTSSQAVRRPVAPPGWRRVEAMFKVISIVDQGDGVFIGHVVKDNLDRNEAEYWCNRGNATVKHLNITELKYHII